MRVRVVSKGQKTAFDYVNHQFLLETVFVNTDLPAYSGLELKRLFYGP